MTLFKKEPLITIFFIVALFHTINDSRIHKEATDKYDGMQGTVIDVTHDLHGRYYPTIRLEDGTTSTVNNGSRTIKVGDSWINHVDYYPYIGLIMGLAYSVLPSYFHNGTLVLYGLVCRLYLVGLILFFIGSIYLKVMKKWRSFVDSKLEKSS